MEHQPKMAHHWYYQPKNKLSSPDRLFQYNGIKLHTSQKMEHQPKMAHQPKNKLSSPDRLFQYNGIKLHTSQKMEQKPKNETPAKNGTPLVLQTKK